MNRHQTIGTTNNSYILLTCTYSIWKSCTKARYLHVYIPLSDSVLDSGSVRQWTERGHSKIPESAHVWLSHPPGKEWGVTDKQMASRTDLQTSTIKPTRCERDTKTMCLQGRSYKYQQLSVSTHSLFYTFSCPRHCRRVALILRGNKTEESSTHSLQKSFILTSPDRFEATSSIVSPDVSVATQH